MPLVPLQLPPGVYRNGTDYQSAGRWRDASLVRWGDGIMQPVGGWQSRATVATDKPMRGAMAWRTLSGDRWLSFGSYEKLYAVSTAGTVTDITPAGFTAGTKDASQNLGYGGGLYGTGSYGTPRPDVGIYGEAATWAMDTFGEIPVFCAYPDGGLYEWDLDVLNDAVAVTGAPTDNLSCLVTEERFLVALGAGGNPRKVQWSDREDRTTWTPAATNEAGDIELQTSGQIMQGIRTRGQALILTDIDAHTMTYIGSPFVYGFERVGSACGAISRKAAAAVDAGVFWMGSRGFFRFAGGAVEEIPCEVLDYVFANLNEVQRTKVYAIANARYSEVWWFYPSDLENDSYVSYNYKENHWSIGSIARTSGVDAGVFSTPIWTGANGIAYNHEIGNAYGGASIYAESGAIQIGAGDNVANALMLIPDEGTQGEVTATFKTRFHPNDTERTYGPYSMANPTNVRFTGRQVAMRVNGTEANWRWGVPRLEVKAGGLR